MKFGIQISFFFLLLAYLPFSYAIEQNEIISTLKKSLPSNWQVHEVISDSKPRWSFSDDRCVLVKLYGTSMRGYKYYGKQGEYIGQKLIFNEAIMIWVGADKFDPELSIVNRFLNIFKIVPKKIPTVIFEADGYTVYGLEGTIVLPENDAAYKTSPKGTHRGVPLDFINGRSWISWKNDIQRSLENSANQIPQ